MTAKVKEAACAMASLSVYRGILKRTVPKALFRLLWAEDEKAFLQAWGSFLAVLCERGFSENLMECISQTALFDENAFSLAAAAGETEFPPSLMAAVEHDLKVILDISALTPEDLLRGCPFEAMRGMQLPGWQTGEPMEALRGPIDGCISRMAAYYRANGCGMYARYRAFIWRDGAIQPVAYPDKTRLQDLKGYDVPRREAIENTLAFLEGLPANNCLMYGDRGTGKSSTVKALLNEFYPKGLRVIEMPKESLMDFPKLVDQIAAVPMKFIIFIDDLSFSNQDDTYAALKAVLQGGLAAQPDNALIYATSNRRHLVRQSFSDRAGDEVDAFETISEKTALAERFGLRIPYLTMSKADYLALVDHLAARAGVAMSAELLHAQAMTWEIRHAGRTPRTAQQFIASLSLQEKQ